VISRATVVWFGLFALLTLLLLGVQWAWSRPCRESKTAHTGAYAAYDDTAAWREPDGIYVAAINLCTTWLWRSLPLPVKLYALVWLVSLIGFLRSFVVDIVRRWRKRRHELGIAAPLEQQPPKL
jgi:hypothetical protein